MKIPKLSFSWTHFSKNLGVFQSTALFLYSVLKLHKTAITTDSKLTDI